MAEIGHLNWRKWRTSFVSKYPSSKEIGKSCLIAFSWSLLDKKIDMAKNTNLDQYYQEFLLKTWDSVETEFFLRRKNLWWNSFFVYGLCFCLELFIWRNLSKLVWFFAPAQRFCTREGQPGVKKMWKSLETRYRERDRNCRDIFRRTS